MELEEPECCKTPRNQECQIQAAKVCPPPPRKKNMEARKRRAPPENGYFNPPELDSFFDSVTRQEAWT
ncbi:cyclin-dependent protein kinase inhibitor SMR4 [Primulina eburnea]|uniref:cyclin-dependent protein kinase inhibitor SMR4 n=1 Tax=Primulina eburnea TaxID=1245227 RepID=UPI003C6C7A6A